LSDAKRRFRRPSGGILATDPASRSFRPRRTENCRNDGGIFGVTSLLGVLVGAVILFGCGSSQPVEPIAASVGFDISVTSSPPGIRQGYAGAGTALVNAVVARGGTLRVKAFRGAAVDLAALEGDPEVSTARRRRDLEAAGALSALTSAVEGTLGLKRATAALQAQIDTLPEGSSVAAALRLAVEDVKGAAGERFAVIVSDGRDNVLPDGVNADDASTGPRVLANVLIDELDGLDASGVTVVIVGIGQGLRAAPAARLTEAWRIACAATEAERCIVDADPSAATELIE
jgi:hypothetical protein